MSGAITSKEKLEQEKAARTIFSRLMRFERTDISVLNSAHEYKRRGSLVYLQLLIVKYLFPLPFKKTKQKKKKKNQLEYIRQNGFGGKNNLRSWGLGEAILEVVCGPCPFIMGL